MRAIALVLLAAAAPSDELAERVDALLARWNRADAPGGAVAVLRAGEPVLVRAFGLADLEAERPVTEHTPFYLASLAKPFTAACAVRAAQAGELDLDASVRELFPELPEGYRAATLRHCMHQRSGIPDVYDVAIAADLGPEGVGSNAKAIELLARLPGPDFEPGSSVRYCNSGYVLLAEAIRRATGRDLDAYARERLFEPSGMSDASYRGGDRGPAPARAYRPSAEGWEPIEHDTGLCGPGGLTASLADLTAFAAKPLDPQLVRAPDGPHHPRFGPYAAGWMLQRLGGQRAQRHSGGAFGFSSDLIAFPEAGVTVIALSNCAELSASDLALDLARAALGEQWMEVARPQAVSSSSADLARFGRFWIEPVRQELWVLVPRGGQLEVVALGDVRLRLVAVSKTRLESIDAQVPFAMELDGEHLVLDVAGARKRLDPIPFPPTGLAPISEYTGRWRSAGLRAEIVLEERDGRLALRQGRPILALPPFHAIAPDLFLCDLGAVLRFRRDEQGSIARLTLDVNRASGLDFERVPTDR
jgi:CubicO group peptidase (beta-lactamase class C family)